MATLLLLTITVAAGVGVSIYTHGFNPSGESPAPLALNQMGEGSAPGYHFARFQVSAVSARDLDWGDVDLKLDGEPRTALRGIDCQAPMTGPVTGGDHFCVTDAQPLRGRVLTLQHSFAGTVQVMVTA